ncbi:MAG: carboxylate--amine ligase, partial [Gemmatimonadota bacterium]|nr:carboxylate--amine ligase [Gemmatimonadota bacterium]
MTGVAVTDGDERSALAVVRSLGRAGHAVDVVSRTGRSLAGASRYARSDTAAPDPLGDRAAFRRAVRNLVADRSSAVLLPITEASLHALLPQRDELGDVRIPCPDYEAFLDAADKA